MEQSVSAAVTLSIQVGSTPSRSPLQKTEIALNDQDRRTLLAVVLAFMTYYVWSSYFMPKPSDGAGSGEGSGEPAGESATANPTPATQAATGASDSVPTVQNCTGSRENIVFSQVEFGATDCGGFKALNLPMIDAAMHVTPWWTWVWGSISGTHEGSWEPYAPAGERESLISMAGRYGLVGAGNPLQPQQVAWQVEKQGQSVQLVRNDGSLKIIQKLEPTADPDLFAMTVRWEAQGAEVQGPFWLGYEDKFVQAKNIYSPDLHVGAVVDGDLETLGNPADTRETIKIWEGPVSWLGTQDRYFVAAMLPETAESWKQVSIRQFDTEVTRVWATHSKTSLAAGEALEEKFQIYVGNKDVERLAMVGKGLDQAAQLGFFGFFSKILLFFLHLFHAGIQNWGLSIIALTFFVRASLYPLAARAFKSGKAMQVLQPKLKELQEIHKDDRDRLNQETMKLFMENNVNPLGGCLPMLVQMPIFFALYSALQVTPDLYHQTFLYIQDLSAPDPYGFFPTLMAAGMIIQQQMTPMTGMDPVQQRMMKMMPLMFALFMFTVPAGLAIYYSINTALSILQQWYNTRSYALSSTTR